MKKYKHWGLNLDIKRDRVLYILSPLITYILILIIFAIVKLSTPDDLSPVWRFILGINILVIGWNTVVMMNYDLKKTEERIRKQIFGE